MTLRLRLRIALLSFATLVIAHPSRAAAPPVTLEQIMADPDWIGNPPEHPYWSADGRTVYYEQKRAGSELRDLVRLDVASGASRVVPPAERGTAEAADGDWSRDRK